MSLKFTKLTTIRLRRNYKARSWRGDSNSQPLGFKTRYSSHYCSNFTSLWNIHIAAVEQHTLIRCSMMT